MIRNICYFKSLELHIIEEIVYLMKPMQYEAGTLIVKRGDNVDNIMLLKAGKISVEVPTKGNKSIFLDELNQGSCFCIYSAFSNEVS
mmetsp:Transcript_115748/g.160608  ORF Transcript_115748/g.160608 Transcript_115748/m.160608 type:complete len:87 (+) Transcript_115748:187-447(+)